LRELSGEEKRVLAHPDCPFPSWVLGVIDAALGRKKEALRDGSRAVQLLPMEKDALDGKFLIKNLAIIAAWVGEKDLACEQFAKAIWYPMYPRAVRLWRIETAPDLGSIARRSALRKNRRLTRAEVIL
jgi:hypothetical protein